MTTRNKLLITPLLVLFSVSLESFGSSITISMHGDLDDDLFVTKHLYNKWSFEDCFQMHNPKGVFYLDGKKTVSSHAPGWMDYDKNISVDKNEIIMISLANEREEMHDEKILYSRTHAKSSEVLVGKEVLIPSMNPEKNDIADAPLWFDASSDKKDYNYYNLWENAVFSIGLIVAESGKYTISLFNQNGILVASDIFNIQKETVNIRFKKTILGKIDSHTLAEVDGGVFGVTNKFPPDDEKVKEFVPSYIGIQSEDGAVTNIPIPYPFPYINRIFCKSL